MAELAKLNIVIRNGSKAEKKRLRNNGYLVGNISRRGMESVAIAMKKTEFRKVLKEHGRNAVLTLVSSDETSFHAMVKEIQVLPPDYDFAHVDFQQVSLDEKVKADVPIRYVGVEYIEANRYIINRLMDEIPVIGLPQDIPADIEIDVSKLNLGDTLTIGDMKFPDGISPDIDANQLVLSISEAKNQVEEETEPEIA